MADTMKVNGRITTWKAWESTFGVTDASIRDIIKTIRNRVSAFTRGLMVDAMKATGGEGNNTDLALISCPRMVKLNQDSGKTANE